MDTVPPSIYLNDTLTIWDIANELTECYGPYPRHWGRGVTEDGIYLYREGQSDLGKPWYNMALRFVVDGTIYQFRHTRMAWVRMEDPPSRRHYYRMSRDASKVTTENGSRLREQLTYTRLMKDGYCPTFDLL